jgi:hypothetical protein
MPEPEIEKRSDRAGPATIAAVATKRTSQTSDTNGATPSADKPAFRCFDQGSDLLQAT